MLVITRSACANGRTSAPCQRTSESEIPHRGAFAMAKIIVSYDDTDNDRDALALGRTLGELGGNISLAYVRHTQQPDRAREALEEKEAEELLQHGAQAL